LLGLFDGISLFFGRLQIPSRVQMLVFATIAMEAGIASGNGDMIPGCSSSSDCATDDFMFCSTKCDNAAGDVFGVDCPDTGAGTEWEGVTTAG
jgi:hypothetical protein